MAQRLYVDSNYTQEEVASIIGVTRQTIIRWSREHHWQELKAATSVSPAEQIRQLRQQIANINEAILARPIAERWATPAEADSLNKLATAIGVPPRRINEIVHGKRGITADTAVRLAKYFGTSAELWMNLQSHYELRLERRALREQLDNIVPLQSVP